MKIATITLNPAIDQTVKIDGFRPNTVNRGQSMQFNAGGKGINVAAFLADSGYDVAVTGFLGLDNAEIFTKFFAHKGFENHFVQIAGGTRIGVKLVDEITQQTTDINMPGLTPSAEALAQLSHTIEQLTTSCDWFVLAGTLPPGVSTTIYATIITQLKKAGKQIVLDTSGEALQHGVLAGPTIIKPNVDELQQLVGYELTSSVAVEQAARQLLNSDIQLVVVSMGKEGALFVNRDSALVAIPPTVKIKTTVGAGDAMVAGLIVGQLQGSSLSDCARLATAFALGRITQVGSQLPTPEILQAYAHQVSIQIRTSVPRSA